MYNISSHESAFFKRFTAKSLLQALEHEEKVHVYCILPSAVYFNAQTVHGVHLLGPIFHNIGQTRSKHRHETNTFLR